MQPITTRREQGMSTHHPTYAAEANPAFDNRRSRCISVPNGDWKVSVKPSNHPPMPSSRQQAATINIRTHGSHTLHYHNNRQHPEVSSNGAFHMRKHHGRMMQHHQQRPASFVGGFVVPPPLLHSHAPMVAPQPSSSTQPYQSLMTRSFNNNIPTTTTTTTATTTTNRHHHPRNIPTSSSSQPSQCHDNQKKHPRRIRVQSINEMHRVWIDVAPNETGYTLAEKIHTIATFRTMKIISMTSANGRPIPLTKQPVFTSWDDLQDFVDGEEWKVEWVPLERRNLIDRIMSRVVQVDHS